MALRLISQHTTYIILINESSDSNHLSTFTVLVVVVFTKKRRKKKTKIANKANILPSTEYCSVRLRIILILWVL